MTLNHLFQIDLTLKHSFLFKISEFITAIIELYETIKKGEITMKNKPLLVFMHIPKTAGNSIKYMLNSNGEHLVRWSKWNVQGWQTEYLYDITLDDACIVGGHKTFEEWNFMLRNHNRHMLYFAIVREPQERVISQYKFILLHNHHPRNKNLSRNIKEVFSVENDYAEFDRDKQCYFFDSSKDYNQVLNSLKNNPFVVGKMENLEETTKYFKNTLGFSDIEIILPKLNVTEKKKEDWDYLNNFFSKTKLLENDDKLYSSLDNFNTSVTEKEAVDFKNHMQHLMQKQHTN